MVNPFVKVILFFALLPTYPLNIHVTMLMYRMSVLYESTVYVCFTADSSQVYTTETLFYSPFSTFFHWRLRCFYSMNVAGVKSSGVVLALTV